MLLYTKKDMNKEMCLEIYIILEAQPIHEEMVIWTLFIRIKNFCPMKENEKISHRWGENIYNLKTLKFQNSTM